MQKAAHAALYGFGKNAVNLARVGFMLAHRAGRIRQKGIVKLVCIGPDLARNETVRAAQ